MASVPTLPHPLNRSWTEPPLLRLPDRNRESWTRDAAALTFPDYHDLNAWNAFRDASVHLALRHLPEHFAEALDEFFTPGPASPLSCSKTFRSIPNCLRLRPMECAPSSSKPSPRP